jgi:hypothetical protein
VVFAACEKPPEEGTILSLVDVNKKFKINLWY